MMFLLLTQAFALTIPQLLRIATDALAASDWDQVRQAGVYMVGVAVLGAGARISSRILIFNSGRKVEYDVRNDLFTQLSLLPPSFYSDMPTGQIMSRAVNDLTQVRLLLGPGLLNLTNTALVYLVVVPFLIATDWQLALCSLATLPCLMVAGRWMGKLIYEYNRSAQEHLGNLSNRVQENLGGFTTVRVYRRVDAELTRFQALNDLYYAANVRLAKLRGVLFPVMGLFGAFGSVVLLYLGGMRMIDGRMTVGDFVQFNAYLAALTWPTVALGWMISLWNRGLSAMERINEIFAAPLTIADGDEAANERRGRIEIRNLTFSYPNTNQPALEDISTTFEPGERIVIVGRTGAGKSTLLRAIARLIEVPAGSVFIDGKDTLDIPLADARGILTYAPQTAFLFSRSIAENIGFGRPNASLEQIRAASERAGLAPDLDGFPEGLETIVGERGVTLSGGQRQRTALARALLLDAPVLLLDDTLAAVDTETETKILHTLAAQRGQTTVLVTHRLAGAADADRILVLDAGKIVEQGTESELLELGGIYAQMHQRQRLREAAQATGGHASASAVARAVGAGG